MSQQPPIEIEGERHMLQVPEFAPAAPMPAFEASGEPPESGTNWRRYLAAVLRYKWLILAVTIVGTVAGGGLSKLLPPEYLAQGTIWIEATSQQQAGNRGPITQGQLLDSYAWVELLRSFEVVEHVARQYRLYLSIGQTSDTALFRSFDIGDRIFPGDYSLSVDASGTTYTLLRDDDPVESGAVGSPIGAELGFNWSPSPDLLVPGTDAAFSVTTPREAAVRLNEVLNPVLDVKGNFMRVDLAGRNRFRVAATLNAVLDRYVELAAAIKKDRLTELTRILNEQLRSAENKLTDSEEALETFRVRTITLPSEDLVGSPVQPGVQRTERPVFDNFFDLQIERDQLRQDQIVLQRSLNSSQGVSLEAIEALAVVTNSSQLQQLIRDLTTARSQLEALRQRYTDDHPAVIKAVDEMRRIRLEAIPREVRLLIEELKRRENELNAQIASASRNLEEIPRRSIEEARLRRNVNIADLLYTDIQQRYEEARLSEASSIPDVRVLDRAVAPQRPINDRGPQFMAMALMASLGMATIGAILLDRMDRRVRYPEQVTQELGLRILGVIQRVPGGRRGGNDRDSLHHVIEALRGIRLNLIHGHVGPGPLVLTITSPGSGDGKSFIASNLALSFAEAGYRTLVIDGDIRRGRLHRLFNARRRPGLTELLKGEAQLPEVMQVTEFPLLSFIGCGTRTQAAPELLGSAEMSQLLAHARSQFNVVIVDSPPMGAGVDPFAVGGLTGNMMLVIRNGATDRELAEAKLEVLHRLPIRVLGAVLNDVRPGRVNGYGYYTYYLPGYAAEDEPDPREEIEAGGRLLGRAVAGRNSSG